MYSDIGIMQKISSRTENGEVYYYTGAYSGDHTFIIKARFGNGSLLHSLILSMNKMGKRNLCEG